MYIQLDTYQQDEKVRVIDTHGNEVVGRILRITPQKGNYCLLSVLTDEKKEVVVVQYKNKISKLNG